MMMVVSEHVASKHVLLFKMAKAMSSSTLRLSTERWWHVITTNTKTTNKAINEVQFSKRSKTDNLWFSFSAGVLLKFYWTCLITMMMVIDLSGMEFIAFSKPQIDFKPSHLISSLNGVRKITPFWETEQQSGWWRGCSFQFTHLWLTHSLAVQSEA